MDLVERAPRSQQGVSQPNVYRTAGRAVVGSATRRSKRRRRESCSGTRLLVADDVDTRTFLAAGRQRESDDGSVSNELRQRREPPGRGVGPVGGDGREQVTRPKTMTWGLSISVCIRSPSSGPPKPKYGPTSTSTAPAKPSRLTLVEVSPRRYAAHLLRARFARVRSPRANLGRRPRCGRWTLGRVSAMEHVRVEVEPVRPDDRAQLEVDADLTEVCGVAERFAHRAP